MGNSIFSNCLNATEHHHSESGSEEMGMLWTFVSSLVFFLVSFVLCLIPKIFRNVGFIKILIGYSNPIMVGFLLPMIFLDSLIHLRPHSHDSIEANDKVGLFACILACVILYLVDLVFKPTGESVNEQPTYKHQRDVSTVEHASNSLIGVDTSSDERHTVTINVGSSSTHTDHHNHNHHVEDSCCNTDVIKTGSLKDVIVVFIGALSVHAIFEGMGYDGSGSVGPYEIVMMIHKTFESLAVGFALNESEFSFRKVLIIGAVFSILMPIGMLLGSIIKSASLVIFGISLSTICQGLATGSLIYITLAKMMSLSLKKKMSKLLNAFLFVSSFLIASLFFFFAPHKHSH